MELTEDRDVRLSYARDASGLEMIPDAVARAECIDDVVAIVRDAIGAGKSVTAAGAQTSTTAASITDTGILLSLRGMARVIDIDPEGRIARVEPGVTIGALNEELEPLGLRVCARPNERERRDDRRRNCLQRLRRALAAIWCDTRARARRSHCRR